jgi:LCP family protein required for cell wall assembly
MPQQTASRAESSSHQVKPTKKSKKIRSPLGAKVVVVFGVVLSLVGFGGLAAAKSVMSDLTGSIETGTTDTQAPAPQGKPLTGAIDLLLLGLDQRESWKANSARADTIMMLHVSAAHDEAYLMSVPRDAKVRIPAWPKAGYGGGTDRINSAFYAGSQRDQGWQGGAGLTRKTISELTGITFDGVIVIDFNGFKNVINALGGVYLCVERDTWSSHYNVTPQGKPVYAPGDPLKPRPNSWWHKKGCRDMAGWEALDYARQRHGLPNGDYDRQRHQQQLIKAMAKKAASAGVLTNPAKLSTLLKAAGASLKMDTGGYDVDDFLFNLKVIASADLVTLKTNSGTFNSAGDGSEQLKAETMRMFAAARDDKLGEYVQDNLAVLIGGGAS